MPKSCCSTPRCCDFSRGNDSSASGCTQMLPFKSAVRIERASRTPSGPSSGISTSSGRFLRKASTEDVEIPQHVGVKLFCAPPHQAEAAHGLVTRQRVAGGGLHVFHVAAENRGKEPGQELRDRAN